MITLTLDMEQYDCPFIDTTDDHDVSFGTLHWDFHDATGQLETRLIVEGADQGTLEDGLHALTAHRNMHDYELLSKRDDVAQIRTMIAETNAMRVIRNYDGYITGPFHIEDASELWNVGFDSHGVTDDALCALESNNDFSVVSRDRLDLRTLRQVSQNMDAARTLVEGADALSAVEHRTLEAAVDLGYFNTPRDATLSTIAEEFGVSSPAVSKNLRRAQRKVVKSVVDAMEDFN
jgi:predicted DNA binding protein